METNTMELSMEEMANVAAGMCPDDLKSPLRKEEKWVDGFLDLVRNIYKKAFVLERTLN